MEPDRLLEALTNTVIGIVCREGRDLTVRQLGVLLIVYHEEGPQTVRALAARLTVPKPSISRALDRLSELGLAHREPDPRDARSVLLQRTRAGSNFIRELRQLLNTGMKAKQGPGAV
jgi:DNA-binding MarR family transcriptional regulator